MTKKRDDLDRLDDLVLDVLAETGQWAFAVGYLMPSLKHLGRRMPGFTDETEWQYVERTLLELKELLEKPAEDGQAYVDACDEAGRIEVPD